MIILDHDRDILLVEMGGGDEFFIINKVHPDITDFAETVRSSKDGEHLVFHKPVYLVINNYSPKKQTIEAIYFARAIEEGKLPHLKRVTIDIWAKEALRYNEIEPISVVPRLNWAILYPNEIAIADFDDCGHKGWIITPEEVNTYKKTLPMSKDSNNLKKMWIIYYNDKQITFEWKKKPEKTSLVDEVIEIEYDSASLRCKSIKCLTRRCTSGFAQYRNNPNKYIHIRDRLPISINPPQ